MKRKVSICLIVALFGCISVFSSCSVWNINMLSLRDTQAGEYFNAPSDVYICFEGNMTAKNNAVNAMTEVKEYLKQAEEALSAENPSGDIGRFNAAAAGETLAVDAIAYEALSLAKVIYKETDGAFNPAVRLSVDLWGFTPRFYDGEYSPVEPYDRTDPTAELPDERYVSAFQTLSDFSAVEVWQENSAYYVRKPSDVVQIDGKSYTLQLDLGGFGKGFAADGAADILRKRGIEYGYVSLGGSSIALLKYPIADMGEGQSHDWRVQIGYPDREQAAQGVCFAYTHGQDVGVSTSGDYERFYETDGQRYCHIIDAKTGAPVRTGVCSAFVVDRSAAQADALTTALAVLGQEAGSQFLMAHGKKGAITVRSGEERFYTSFNLSDFTLAEGYQAQFTLTALQEGANE